MRKAALLYNPTSGGSQRRQRELQAALSVLRGGGVEVELLPTDSRDHAVEEARRAVAEECDTIFACGGDGTIHNVVQLLANTPTALAILPMGTANALAHDLGLPMNIPAAAKAALNGRLRRVPLGKIAYRDLAGADRSCFYVVAAGVGVDAHLFYKLHTGQKQRMGMTAYYAKAWNLWWTYPMTKFTAEYVESGTGKSVRAEATELMSIRIRNFGGIVRELAPGASLERAELRLVCCTTASRWDYVGYVARGLVGMKREVAGIDLVWSDSVRCEYVDDRQRVYVEADGELLGTLPAKMTVLPDALSLVAP